MIPCDNPLSGLIWFTIKSMGQIKKIEVGNLAIWFNKVNIRYNESGLWWSQSYFYFILLYACNITFIIIIPSNFHYFYAISHYSNLTFFSIHMEFQRLIDCCCGHPFYSLDPFSDTTRQFMVQNRCWKLNAIPLSNFLHFNPHTPHN